MTALRPVAEEAAAACTRRIRETRLALGLSQAGLSALLAEQAGLKVDPTAITRIESGQRAVTIGEACAFAVVFGVSVENLLGDTAPPPCACCAGNPPPGMRCAMCGENGPPFDRTRSLEELGSPNTP